MSKRKTAPDLLGDLLSENSSHKGVPSENIEPVDKQFIGVQTVLPDDPYSTKSQKYKQRPRPSSALAEKKPKVKMTLMLPPDMMDRLARFEMEMRFETGERGHVLSKSAIITKALEILLDEYDVHHMGSRIARDLTS